MRLARKTAVSHNNDWTLWRSFIIQHGSFKRGNIHAGAELSENILTLELRESAMGWLTDNEKASKIIKERNPHALKTREQ